MSEPRPVYPKPTIVQMLLLRERLGLRRYRKTAARDPLKRKLLLELGLRKIRKAEAANYIPVGVRKRRLLIEGD